MHNVIGTPRLLDSRHAGKGRILQHIEPVTRQHGERHAHGSQRGRDRRGQPVQQVQVEQGDVRAVAGQAGTELKFEQTNQRRLVTEPDALASFEPIMAAAKAMLRNLEAKIADVIAADPMWVALDRAFRSIKGVADRTVARLMAEMPEIGTLSNKAVAKLAGLVPLANDSGKHVGKRPLRGGREGVRSILFVVAEVVRRHEPDFQAFHQKLSAAGKPKKLIRAALARKLLVRLNAKARRVRHELASAT